MGSSFLFFFPKICVYEKIVVPLQQIRFHPSLKKDSLTMEELRQRISNTYRIDLLDAIDAICANIDDLDKIEAILKGYDEKYKLNKEELKTCIEIAQQEGDERAYHLVVLSCFRKIVRQAMKRRFPSDFPFHEALSIYINHIGRAIAKFDTSWGKGFWSYATCGFMGAESEIKRIYEKQFVNLNPIE